MKRVGDISGATLERAYARRRIRQVMAMLVVYALFYICRLAFSGCLVARGADGAATLMGRTFANGWTLDYLAVFWIGVAALSVVFTIAAGRCGRKCKKG